jgi:hypothetical protein
MASRTTLSLDDDVLAAAKAIAKRDGKTTGEALSELARAGIDSRFRTEASRAGFRVLPRRGVIVTPELVNALRDQDG